jgi:FHA domain
MDDDGFITPPPGLLNPDSGTHRRPRPERTERVRSDEIVFVPAAPGVPVVLPDDPPAAPASAPDAFVPPPGAPDVGAVPEPSTVHAPTEQQPTAPIPRVWRLVIPGIAVPVLMDGTAPLFLGRAPVAPPNHPGARVLAVPDPEKSISKTHAMLELELGELRVHDLHSTNGVWVVPEGAEAIEVEPDEPVVIPPGAELELGDVVIRVELV